MNLTIALSWLKDNKLFEPGAKLEPERREVQEAAAKSIESLLAIRKSLYDNLQKLPTSKDNMYREGKRFVYRELIEFVETKINDIECEGISK